MKVDPHLYEEIYYKFNKYFGRYFEIVAINETKSAFRYKIHYINVKLDITSETIYDIYLKDFI